MNRLGRALVIGLVGAVCAGGCASRKSSLLLERQARGPIEEEPSVAQAATWRLDPESQTKTANDVEVTVHYAGRDFLTKFFANKAMFGGYAGKNPFYPEHLVFYVRVANRSQRKIRLSPGEFTLLDDRGNQFSPIGADYVTAFADYRRPVTTMTRGVLEGASPGYFGVSLPIGKLVAQKPQGQFALLQQSALQPGYLYPGVVYDGLIAFWNPSVGQRTLHLLITSIKTNFDASDLPTATVDIPFDFSATATSP